MVNNLSAFKSFLIGGSVLSIKCIELAKKIEERGIGRICNDLLPEELQMLSKEEWVNFARDYHEWNGDLEDFDPNRPVMFDFMVVSFVNHLLREQYKKTEEEKVKK
jgi:hypothetical protein